MRTVTVDRRTFIMWLATINENRVPEGPVRDRVIAFQAEAAGALDAYFAEGIAVNHRRASPAERALIEARHSIISDLHEGHYWLQVAEGRRPEEVPVTPSVAKTKALRAFDRGYVRLVKASSSVSREQSRPAVGP